MKWCMFWNVFYDYVSKVTCGGCAMNITKKNEKKKRPPHPHPSFAIGLVKSAFWDIPWGILFLRLLECTYGFCGFVLSFEVLLGESLPELTPES